MAQEKNKTASDENGFDKEKVLHIRIDPALKKGAVAESKRRNVPLTTYISWLIEENLEWQQIHPYVVLEEKHVVTVKPNLDFVLATSQTILLLKDISEYAYHIDFNLDKVHRFIQDKRSSKSIWSNLGISVKDALDGSDITLPSKAGDLYQLQTGGYKIARFPTRSKGSVLHINIFGEFKRYALATKYDCVASRIAHERDKVLFTPIEPTDSFSMQLNLDKALFERDIALRRLTELQIMRSITFEVCNARQIRISERLPLYGNSDLDLLQDRVTQIQTEDVNYFMFNIDISRPLLGLFYCISWICPLENKEQKRPDKI